MAINWGDTDNHLRVGLSWSISPSSPSHSDTQVKVTYHWYVGSVDFGWDDPQSLVVSATNWSGTTWNYQMVSPYGGTRSIEVGSHSENYDIYYGSHRTVSAHSNVNGAFNDANPIASWDISLPVRPVSTPTNGENPSVSNVTTSSAHISWSAPTDNGGASVDEYQLQVDNSSGFSSPVYNNTFNETGVASDTATGLKANTHYYTRVRAHNSAGWGDWTSATGCQFDTTGAAPSKPSRVAYASRTTSSIDFAWTASSTNGGGSITYTAQCDSNSSFTSPTSKTTTGTDANFTGLSAGTTYYFRVKASNSGGDSAWSDTFSEPTRSVPTYIDANDFVGMVNNLATAVADKLVHLGTFAFRGHVSGLTMANSTIVYVIPGTQIESCTQPDPPSYTGTNQSFTIQYPGTYLIEFCAGIPGGLGQSVEHFIYINGIAAPTSTNGKAGIAAAVQETSNAHGGSSLVSITRRLNAGDTVGFALYQTTGSSVSLNNVTDSDLAAWVRITMTGF